MREKEIHPLHNGHVIHSFKVYNPKSDKDHIGSIANTNQLEILFPLTATLPQKVLWAKCFVTNRYEQKMYTLIFKSGHVLEQYPKIKYCVRQSVRWLEHIPCLMCSNQNIDYTDQSSSIQLNHINKCKVHLNRYGIIGFANTLSKFLSKNCQHYYDNSNKTH